MKRLNAAILAALVAPALALAQAPSTSAPSTPPPSGGTVLTSLPPGALEEMQGFHMGVDLDHAVGSGTFVDTRYYAYFGGSLTLGPSYSFTAKGIKLNASAMEILGWEYTLPDNETGKRVDYSDLRLGLAAPAVYTEAATGISLAPSFGLTVPLSPESRLATTITKLSLGLGLNRTFFEQLDVSYKLTGGRALHVNNQVMVPSDSSICVGRARVDEAFCGSAGNNPAWSLSHSVVIGWRPTERLSFSLSFLISSGWKEAGDIGGTQYNSQALDQYGNPVVKNGMALGNSMAGSIGASYGLTDNLGLSLSMANGGPMGGAVYTADNKAIRFPFFDFIGPAANNTSFSLTLSAML